MSELSRFVCPLCLFWCRLLNVPEAASHRQGCGSTHQQPAISKLFCGVRLVLPAPWGGWEEWVREVGGFLQSGVGAQSSCDRDQAALNGPAVPPRLPILSSLFTVPFSGALARVCLFSWFYQICSLEGLAAGSNASP